MRNKKNQVFVILLIVALVIGITGVVTHNQRVEAERIELQKKQKYQKFMLTVNESVKKAYDTRSEKDIELAEIVIKKLKKQDLKEPKAKMEKLRTQLDLVKKTDQLLKQAEKTKKDSDIQAAQKSIDAEKDAYLSKDKKAHQIRLDKLKKTIADQKAKEKAEKEKKAKEEKAKAEAAQTQVEVAAEAETQVSAETTVSQSEVAQQAEAQPVVTETPTVVTPDVAPASTSAAEEPQYQAPAATQVEQAPVQATPTPETPTVQPPVAQASSGSQLKGNGGPYTEEDVDQLTRWEQEAAKSDWSAFYK
uniref:hypothetical protein n=1 Tax=Enterococcus faecalis TaxID=1351 RepID=UPI00359CB412